MKYDVQLAKESADFQSGPGWIVERKWDGMRALFELSEDETRIFSRTGQDLCPQFPELCDLHIRVGVPCVLDGEVVAMVQDAEWDDKEDLELLQMRLGDKKARRQCIIPVEVRFFDVLEVQGQTVTQMQLWERRDLLASVLDNTEFELPQVLSYMDDIPSHWEGTVSKRDDSRYECGKRRSSWSKWKFTLRATLRVSDLTPGKGARANSFGAAAVVDEDGVLRGQVGSGFTESHIAEMLRQFADPDPDVGILIDVEYRFLSKTGLMVNTSFKGFRPDKSEADRL